MHGRLFVHAFPQEDRSIICWRKREILKYSQCSIARFAVEGSLSLRKGNEKEMHAMVEGRTESVLVTRPKAAEKPRLMSIDGILGKKVTNWEGYDLGEISNLVVDQTGARIVYAVLRYGGMFGLGGKLFAIPLEAMSYRPGDRVFVVAVSKQTLDAEPGFTEGDWPQEADWALIEAARPGEAPVEERVIPVQEPTTEASATDLQSALKGLEYPAGKQDLIDRARENSAPQAVIDTLARFEERTYNSPTEVSQEFGKVR
jgi:sporulation protein YlmC with PRC-barrel domain